MKTVVAIITARGGSKRIPRKNIKKFCGEPIIKYSIRAAIESGVFDEVMVSTDDEEIREIAESCGASCPFMRNAVNANDFATTVDVIKEVLTKYKEIGRIFTHYCVIYPTAPFVTAEKLRTALQILEENRADFLTPVVKYDYPVQRCFVIENGALRKKWPEYQNIRTQDLEPLYYDAGQFYIGDSEKIFTTRYEDRNMTAMILDAAEVQDIDNLKDWEIAEQKFQEMIKNET